MFPFRWRERAEDKYLQLLFAFLFLFLAAPLILRIGFWGEFLLAYILLGTILQVIRTFNVGKRLFRTFLLLGATGVVSGTAIALAELQTPIETILQVVNDLSTIAFFLLVILLFVAKIFRDKTVTIDTLVGGISVYLTIGLMWATIYQLILIFDPLAFALPETQESARSGMFYFSYVTLTTLGYGDIAPVQPVSMLLAALEAIVGQIFPAIFIARLVGLYTAREASDRASSENRDPSE
ncbi:potassium channel family protein [Synechococcus sp. PCC 7336]|uniref:potassium channel family protein n=1 Tax=Synechococcus sp. PCC 7336 TaxID=195250 RepID=UPI0003486DBC|nr:potassium channel family protein [Synechococcus sp. PCC 7336]